MHIDNMWHTRATGWGTSSTIFMRLISRRTLTPCSVWLKLSLRKQRKMLTASSKRWALNRRKSRTFLPLVLPNNTQILRSTKFVIATTIYFAFLPHLHHKARDTIHGSFMLLTENPTMLFRFTSKLRCHLRMQASMRRYSGTGCAKQLHHHCLDCAGRQRMEMKVTARFQTLNLQITPKCFRTQQCAVFGRSFRARRAVINLIVSSRRLQFVSSIFISISGLTLLARCIISDNMQYVIKSSSTRCVPL